MTHDGGYGREPEFEGGAQPVPERPHDQPGPARATAFVLVAILAVLVLALPVAWGLGALVTVGRVLGTAGLVALWIVWLIVASIFVWTLVALWRRAA